MIYTGDLNLGQSIEIENRGGQTRLTLSSHSAGGQQQQSSSFETGAWADAPTLWRDQSGFVLRIHGSQGTQAIRIVGGGISLLDEAPQPQGEEIALRESFDHTSPSLLMRPKKPMEPMRMGSMEMKPGEMRMGNMRMSLGEEASTPELGAPQARVAQPAPQVLGAQPEQGAGVKGRFCTQCGEQAQAEDRFCGSCGYPLRASA